MNEENLNRETYDEDIQSKIRARKNIERLDEAIKLYEAVKKEDYEIAVRLSRIYMQLSCEAARQGLEEMLNNRYSNEMTESYIREYKKAITSAQKTISPELSIDASQLLKRQQTDSNS